MKRLAVFAVVALALGSAPVARAQQAWTPPRTSDGHPDLQGVWLSNRATPLERPKALEGRTTLTDDEVAEYRRRAALLVSDGANDFAAGDALFLAVLANAQRYKSPQSTGSALDMVEREFDNRTALVVDPPDGLVPAMTAEGRQRQAAVGPARIAAHATDPEALTNDVRCLTFGVPRVGGNYGAGHYSYYQIVQTPGYVVLAMEVIHEARIIPLDGSPHLPSDIRRWNGDSRGRWDGDTLVVDTTNFSPKSFFMGSTENLHLTERFTRKGPDAIDYVVTFDDASTWTRSWTTSMHLKRTDQKMYEYACHEGNHVVEGILRGVRAEEKAAEDAARRKQ